MFQHAHIRRILQTIRLGSIVFDLQAQTPNSDFLVCLVAQ